jgi:hypothetical protein
MTCSHDSNLKLKIFRKVTNIMPPKKYYSILLSSVYIQNMLKRICKNEKDNFLKMQINSKKIFDDELNYEYI